MPKWTEHVEADTPDGHVSATKVTTKIGSGMYVWLVLFGLFTVGETNHTWLALPFIFVGLLMANHNRHIK